MATTNLGITLPAASHDIGTDIANIADGFTKTDAAFLGTKQNPTITYGQNLITNAHIADAYPDITFQGQHHVNLLGADGNCEDTAKWTASTAALALDASNKSFGANSIKITASALGVCGFGKAWSACVPDITKYYLVSAYVKNGTATSANVRKDGANGGVNVASVAVSDASKFVRTAFKVKPSDQNASNMFYFLATTSASGQTAYCDGIQINEISATEYANDSEAVLMARYPYVDSYACLQNPSVEIIHDNMVRNGNGEEGVAWWRTNLTGTLSLTYSGGYFALTDTDAANANAMIQDVPVIPGQHYQLRVVAKKGTANARVWVNGLDADKRAVQVLVVDQLVTGPSDTVVSAGILTAAGVRYLRTVVAVDSVEATQGTCYVKEIQLIPGTVAPTAYKPQRREQCVIEGKFATGDTVRLKDGKLEGSLLWEHKTLYGRDYTAWVYTSDATGFKNVRIAEDFRSLYSSAVTGHHLVGPDGRVLAEKTGQAAANQFYVDASNGNLYVSLADAGTGWAEAIAPNADEVKAFMNGWKANANNGTRYTSWVSVVDGSAPTTNTIAYVMANVAPLYKGYQLHYQLANPKAVNEYNCRLKGTLPKLENGVNVVNVDAGLVIGEVASVSLDGTTYAGINVNGGVYLPKPNYLSATPNPLSASVYKNRVKDEVWTQVEGDLGQWSGGAAIYCAYANYDAKAQYTVDYTILRTVAPVVGTPSMEYLPGVTEKVQPQTVQCPAILMIPSFPSNDLGQDGDVCIVQGSDASVGVKRGGKWWMSKRPFTVRVLATIGTFDVDMNDVDLLTLTPTGACTLNATGGKLGDEVTIIVTTSGTSSYVITFGANMKDQGNLTTGTSSGAIFMLTFVHNGTYWIERCRTIAQ